MKKIIIVFLVLIFLGAAGFTFAQQMTDAQRQALIQQIQAQIASLTQQAMQLISQQQGTNWCHDFNSNLGYANSGTAEVAYLHIALQKENISYGSDAINIYSTGTEQAIEQFQQKYYISPVTGYVGPKTRAQLNQLYSCGNYNSDQSSYNYNNSDQTNTYINTNNTTDNSSTCQAKCSSQADGVYAIDCSGNVTKCDANTTCQLTYDTNYSYTGGSVQTINTLTGSECTYNSNTNTNSNSNTNTNTNTCQAACTMQGGNSWAADCYGNATNCTSQGEVCKLTYDTPQATYINGVFNQSSPILNGSECQTPCTPNWQCSGYGSCVNGQQTQTCTDSNSCDTLTNQPALTQSCTSLTNTNTNTNTNNTTTNSSGYGVLVNLKINNLSGYNLFVKSLAFNSIILQGIGTDKYGNNISGIGTTLGITWTSSDTSVATVASIQYNGYNNNASVRALKVGTTTITATVQTSDGSKFTDSMNLNIGDLPININPSGLATLALGGQPLSITASKSSVPLYIDNSSANWNNPWISNNPGDPIWFSSNPYVAQAGFTGVGLNGSINALHSGTAVIYMVERGIDSASGAHVYGNALSNNITITVK